MTWKRKIQLGLFAIALLAVAAAGSVFWFNWWLRFGTTRIYPLCFDGDGYVEFTDLLTPEANAIFIEHMTPWNEGYVWIENGTVIAKNWYWLFGEAEIVQRTNYFLDELAKSQGLDPDEYDFCRHIAQIGTPAHDSHYSGKAYPNNFVHDTLEPWAFGASSERAGHFTPVGRFYQSLGKILGQGEP